MCLLIAVSRVLPEAPLLVAGNRDEAFSRAAEPMTVLRDHPRTIGGRDLVGGGTWLAANEHGVVAGLTNRPLPDGVDPAKRTRGELPLALTAAPTAADAVATFVEHHHPGEYNPAWLLVGDRTSLFSVDLTGEVVTTRELPPGIHVLENRPLTEPSAKVDYVHVLLSGIEGGSVDDALTRLTGIMADHVLHPNPPDTLLENEEIRRAVSAVCVHMPEYGTRWSGLVTVLADPSAPPTFRYTEGRPCEAAFVDAPTG